MHYLHPLMYRIASIEGIFLYYKLNYLFAYVRSFLNSHQNILEQCKSQVVFNVLSSVYELTKMTAVQPNHPSDSTESSRTRWVRDNGNFTSQPFEVEKEIQAHTSKSKERNDIFHNIIRNISSGKKSKQHILMGFMGICGSLLSTCFYTMIPVHDIIQNQNYWYEFPTQLFFGLLPNWVAMILFRCKYYMNINEMKWFRIFLNMWLTGGMVTFIFYSGAYYFWSGYLGLNYPIPLMGYMFAFIMMVTLYTSLWNQFSAEWRQNGIFRHRLMSFFVALLLNQACVFEYAGITKILLLIPEEYQWIAALFLPIIREFNIWIGLKCAKKATGGDVTSAILACNHAVSTTHALFLAYTLGSVATIATSAIILSADFLINLFINAWIIYLRLKNPSEIKKSILLLQILVINELVEFMVPVSYGICFAAAYLGPNSGIHGNVRNSYWQYEAVDSLESALGFICIFFIIDVLSILIGEILLWAFCRIRLHSIYVELQNEFGIGFSVVLATNLNAVSKTYFTYRGNV